MTNEKPETLCWPIRGRASHVNTDHQTQQLSSWGKWAQSFWGTFSISYISRSLNMKGVMFNIDNGYLEGLCRGFKNGEDISQVNSAVIFCQVITLIKAPKNNNLYQPRCAQSKRLLEPGAVRDIGRLEAPPPVDRLWKLPRQWKHSAGVYKKCPWTFHFKILPPLIKPLYTSSYS